MKTKAKLLFIEYGSYNKAQHFITVVVIMNHQRIIIGRIFKEFNNQTKKYEYYSTDALGNRVFADYKELHAIKKQFKEHHETLAMALQTMPKQTKQVGAIPFHHKAKRANEVKNIREKKTDKEKTKEVLKNKISEKRTLDQMERVQDSKNTEKYKDVEHNKDENISKENVQETAESNSSEEQIQGNPEQDIASERMEELEDIRDQGEDLEQEMER
jgi:hypothetical protein